MEVVQNSKNFLKYMQSTDASTKSRRATNKLHFEEQIWPLRNDWYFMSLEEAEERCKKELAQAEDLSERMNECKPGEFSYKEDGKQLKSRLATGNSSEAVIANLFGVPYDDKDGPSKDFYKLDIAGVFGVKSSEYGHVAMVEREPIGPQLIVLKDTRKKKSVEKGFYICGLATVSMQLKYETIHRLTYTDAYYKVGKPKTGFYGYKKLIPVGKEHLTIPKMKALIRKHEDKHWWMWLKKNKERLESGKLKL